MNLLEIKNEINIRINLLKVSIRFSTKESLTYAINNYGMLLSTVFYMLTYLVMIDAIFGRMPKIAGFTYNEILFMSIINQIAFFVLWSLSMNNIEKFVTDILNGNLDLLLIKPVPHLWFVSLRSINLVEIVGHGIPSTVMPIFLLIYKGGVSLKLIDWVFGLGVMICGLIIVHCFQFVVATFAFKTESGKGLVRLAFELTFFGEATPWTGYPNWIKIIGLTVIPNLFHIALASAIMLGKIENKFEWLCFSILAVIISIQIKKYFWKNGVKYYMSASS